MKVLFAVSNEEISEAIVKKYQKEYKEIISYKNVYYFNAIIKEIQKDKTYDRIVISEELEAFTNTQYDQIDKFIFEKLDSISDEASNSRGDNTPIVLICSDRRAKGEDMLVKLFGIGIYDALIGNDRSVDEVCRLINKPRTKKAAKVYYKIEADEVKYQAENENDVSEQEIQNILAHYKKLGKNEDKYVISFNNIVEQYNDTQLRIISKFLPLNVRTVLEERSPKYQQIMSFNNAVSDKIRKPNKEQDLGPSGKLLKTKSSSNPLTAPVVIPSSVDTNNVRKLARTKTVEEDNTINQDIEDMLFSEPQETKRRGRPKKNVEETSTYDIEPEVTKRRGRPRKNPIPEETFEEEPSVLPGFESANQTNNFEEDSILPGFESANQTNNFEEDSILPGFENTNTANNVEQDSILPGFENVNQTNNFGNEAILPGFENVNFANDFANEEILPGFENVGQARNFAADGLPGFENVNKANNFEDEGILPGFETANNKKKEAEPKPVEVEDEGILPGFENVNYVNDFEEVNNNINKNIEKPRVENKNNNMVNSNKQYVPENISNQFDTNYENQNYGYNSTNANQMQETDFARLLTNEKKVVTFVGTSKNGTSFILNNLAEYASSMGINVAILDTTQNKNSYYIYTKNEEELRQIASNCLDNLVNGQAKGISVNRNLTVYTSLPEDRENLNNVSQILETLVRMHDLILIDCDFKTPYEYFLNSQETFLIQSLDILTIQPLTAFLRELKAKNVLNQNKLKIILNKYVKVRGISEKTIIGGMSKYNDPAMSFMTDLFDVNAVKYITIPFEQEIYARYLESVINCDVSIKGYSKTFMQILKDLNNWVYPMNNVNNTYRPPAPSYNGAFSPSMNNTLNQMKRKY